MIFSLNNLFSDQQAITGNAASTNHIDLGAVGTPYGAAAPIGRDQGKGNKICLLAQVTEDFDALTSLAISVQQDSDSGFGTAETLLTETVLLADLIAGKQMNLDVVPRGSNKRYLRMNYVVTGTNPAQGKITAGITLGNHSNY